MNSRKVILTLQASPGCVYTDTSRRKKSQECLPTLPPCESSLKQKEIVDKANNLEKKAILFTMKESM